MKEYIWPKSVITGTDTDTRNLCIRQPLQIDLAEPKTTVFEKGDYVILDYGKEMCGSIRIFTHIAKNTPVRIRFGESVTECTSDVGGATNATNDHSLRDFNVNLQNYSDMTFANTGFRFVRLDFDARAEIKSIVAVNNILKRNAVYTYSGNDERIKEIFDAAKRTVDLCASSGYVWDGVKRDRLVWVGDLSPEVIALTTLYGRLPCIERSLDFARRQTPLPGWMNTMQTYSLWWIIILADYYKRTGAASFVKKQLSYLSALLRQISDYVKEDGDLNYPAYFVDWPTHGKPDEKAGVRAINIIAMKSAIFILKEFGKDYSLAQDILDRLLKIDITVQSSKQVLGLKHFATELTETDKKMLVDGGASGMSTFMSYYILKAVASFDRDKAIEMMKEYYGGMLDKGATTFWEDFDVRWMENSSRIDEFPKNNELDIHADFGAFCYKGHRHSLCHGWSAGIIGFMKEEGI